MSASNPNRFFDIPGDVSMQLAPWSLRDEKKPINEAWFRLREPIRYRSDVAGGVLVVPEKFLSDLASIPRFAWALFMAPDDPRIELGGWVHDYLYGLNGKIPLEDLTSCTLTRQQCDAILAFEAMRELEAPSWRRWAVYLALRGFGWAAWNHHTRLLRDRHQLSLTPAISVTPTG